MALAPPGMDMISSPRWMPKGHIDPVLWKKYRDYRRVRRFWDGEDDEVGRLIHRPGGANRARWVFDYRDDEDGDDEAGYRFESHSFWPGEYVLITGQERKLHTFRVVTVIPVVLSMALIKLFSAADPVTSADQCAAVRRGRRSRYCRDRATCRAHRRYLRRAPAE